MILYKSLFETLVYFVELLLILRIKFLVLKIALSVLLSLIPHVTAFVQVLAMGLILVFGVNLFNLLEEGLILLVQLPLPLLRFLCKFHYPLDVLLHQLVVHRVSALLGQEAPHLEQQVSDGYVVGEGGMLLLPYGSARTSVIARKTLVDGLFD